MFGVSSSVTHHTDDSSDEKEEGRTSGGTRDNSDIGGREGAVLSTRSS